MTAGNECVGVFGEEGCDVVGQGYVEETRSM